MNTRVALAQIDVRVGDLDYNLQRHVEFTNTALSKEADIIIFPELSFCGYNLKDLVHEVSQTAYRDHPEFQQLLMLSNEIQILAGGVEETRGFRYHNAAFLLAGGETKIVHRKIYLPTYGMFEERRYFLPGSTARVFPGPHGKWGALICEDLWHISVPYLLAQDGADVLVGLAASPTRLGGEMDSEPAVSEINMEHHRTYARLLSCYVIFCNRVGFEDGISFWGGSSVIAPNGELVERAPFFDESLLIADLSWGEIKRARRDSRHALDEQPELVVRELQRIIADQNVE